MTSHLMNVIALIAGAAAATPVLGQIEFVQDLLPPAVVENGQYGVSVAIDGDILVVGSRQEAAYVYELNEVTQTWGLIATLTSSNNAGDDDFGAQVAIDGDTIVVAAPNRPVPSTQTGAVYVYEKPAGGWTNMTEDAQLNPSGQSSFPRFGFVLDISGDTVAVGSGDERAWIFDEPAGGWAGQLTTPAILTDVDGPSDFDRFAEAIAIHGDTVVVGAILEDNGAENAGSVWVFERTGPSAWARIGELRSSSPEVSDFFGRAVDLNDDRIVVGAYCDGPSCTGAVFTYEKPVGGWMTMTETRFIASPLGSTVGHWGESIVLSGERLIAGGPLHSGQQGAAVAYERDVMGNWLMIDVVNNPDGDSGDRFGVSVDWSGTQVVVGEIGEVDGQLNLSGRARVYSVEGGPIPFGLTSPSPGETVFTTTPVFTWEASPDADSYDLFVDDNPDFSSPVVTATGLTTNSFDPSARGTLSPGTYYWSVVGRNAEGTTPGNPAGAAFTVRLLPTEFDLLAPAEAALIDTTPTPTFTWDAAMNVDSYNIIIDDDADLASPVVFETGLTANEYTAAFGALSDGTWYWGVEAVNSHGIQMSSPGVRSFDLIVTPAPLTLISPADSGFIETTTPMFTWSLSARADQYRLFIDDNADFSSPEYVHATGDLFHTVPDGVLNGGVIYSWKVEAVNALGTTTSPAWRLLIPGGGGGSACPGDVNGDNAVNFTDLEQLLENWNTTCP